MNPISGGQQAFEAYSKAVGGQTFDGRPIPTWGELTDSVRTGWEAAADAVTKKLPISPERVIELRAKLERFQNLHVDTTGMMSTIRELLEALEEYFA